MIKTYQICYLKRHIDLIKNLLFDQNTKSNLVFANNPKRNKNKQLDLKNTFFNKLFWLNKFVKKNNNDTNRVKTHAEVFTSSFICNIQNNIADEVNLNLKQLFENYKWRKIQAKVLNSNWKKYINKTFLEISCGEAPYITNIYNYENNHFVKLKNQLGALDRKLKIINKKCKTSKKWIKFATNALCCVYGFEFQGDNLLVARINILITLWNNYQSCFYKMPNKKTLILWSYIISWNFWQMDGIKMVVPYSCKKELIEQKQFFKESIKKEIDCLGCTKNNVFLHNGIRCKIINWRQMQIIDFLNFFKVVNNE